MKSFSVQVVETAALALLLCSLAAGQVSQCAATGSPKLRFVAQLSVNGCALFVHDTGASDGPHLAVEPVMCVTDRLEGLSPLYDAVTDVLYLSIPVLLRDAGMLAAAQRQLEHLSPRSVSFLTISSIQASMENNVTVQVDSFIWSPDESTGFIRLRSRSTDDIFLIASKIRSAPSVVLNNLMLTASTRVNDTCHQLSYRPMLQNQTFFDAEVVQQKYSLPACRQLRFIRSINLENCTARVHQRLDIKGHFLIEPLLCHNISSLSSESVMYDYSRSMYYLKLDVVLEDEATLEAVRSQLADLYPRSVTFMKLWSAQSIVSSALSSRFSIGSLRVSADWKTAQLQLFCRFEKQCHVLRSGIISEPVNLFRHIGWQVTSIVSQRCLAKLDETRFLWRMRQSGAVFQQARFICDVLRNSGLQKRFCSSKFLTVRQVGLLSIRYFIKIQQRTTGSVSFQRTWAEYEAGFGDETDFWIGLSAIHSLSAGGATLRVEVELLNGTELHVEYAGFKVGDASTKYEMTYREMLRNRSNYVRLDVMSSHKGMRFSTMDSDNDGYSNRSCSNTYGKGGWWFDYCFNWNPNGLYPSTESLNVAYMAWHGFDKWVYFRKVRLLLEL